MRFFDDLGSRGSACGDEHESVRRRAQADHHRVRAEGGTS